MEDYTYLNNVPAYRLHKRNAAEVAQSARDAMCQLREGMISLAAAHATTALYNGEPMPWHEYAARMVPEILEEYEAAAHEMFLATYIVENPDACEDDLEDAYA